MFHQTPPHVSLFPSMSPSFSVACSINPRRMSHILPQCPHHALAGISLLSACGFSLMLFVRSAPARTSLATCRSTGWLAGPCRTLVASSLMLFLRSAPGRKSAPTCTQTGRSPFSIACSINPRRMSHYSPQCPHHFASHVSSIPAVCPHYPPQCPHHALAWISLLSACNFSVMLFVRWAPDRKSVATCT